MQYLKEEKIVEIIREELLNRKHLLKSEDIVPVVEKTFIHKLMDKGLPVYEDHLKEILYEESKDELGKIICDIEYKRKIKEMQDEMERNIMRRKDKKKKSQGKKVRQEVVIEKPIDQVELFQRNIQQLITNFSNMVAVQVAGAVKSSKGSRKGTHPSSQNQSRPQTQPESHQNSQRVEKFTSQIQPVITLPAPKVPKIIQKRPSTPDFEDYESPKQFQDLIDPIKQSNIRDNKSRISNKQFQESQDYPDDFIEDSQEQFNQQQSHFFKKRIDNPPPEQYDYGDDLEDLLI